MLNKKRLAMMAVAASMVLPTNLAYFSTITSVLATTEEVTSQADQNQTINDTTSTEDTTNEYTLLTQSTIDGITANTISGKFHKTLSAGKYKLSENITISDNSYIDIDEETTIDLNGKTISSNAKHVFDVNANLTIEGKGTITASYATTNDNGTIFWVNKKAITLTLGEVNLNASDNATFIYGISINKNAAGSIVNATGTKIKAAGGLAVRGDIDTPNCEITLDNVTIESTTPADDPSIGIYQAGPSTITLNNPIITSDACGIEIRAGELTINNGTIEGGTGNLSIAHNNNGTTTENAGLAIAQHISDLPITVKVNGTTISGTAAVAITDPENNQASQQGQTDKDITIEFSKAKLEGTKYNVAYTEDTIPFTLKDTPSTNVTKLASEQEVVTTDDGKSLIKNKLKTAQDEDENTTLVVVENPTTLPYEVTTTRVPSTGGGNKKPTKPVEPEEPMEPVATPTSMYRLYNRLTGEHLYTIDKNERDNLLTSDTWKDEGEGWIAPSISEYPVYRLLNPNNGDHHYTTDKNEFDTLPSYGWVAEGVAFFSADKENPENVLLYRLYNPNATGAGSHHYTVDTNERDVLVAQGWKYEGLAWAGLPANK